jgi:hypothetical protein
MVASGVPATSQAASHACEVLAKTPDMVDRIVAVLMVMKQRTRLLVGVIGIGPSCVGGVIVYLLDTGSQYRLDIFLKIIYPNGKTKKKPLSGGFDLRVDFPYFWS